MKKKMIYLEPAIEEFEMAVENGIAQTQLPPSYGDEGDIEDF